MALPSENRLKSAKLISLICKKGASWKTPFFRVVFLPSRQKQFQSVVVVSKKYDKNAVARNLIRRRINGILQSQLVFSPKKEVLSSSHMYVIFPYESARNASFYDLRSALEKMFISTFHWDFSRKRSEKKRGNRM